MNKNSNLKNITFYKNNTNRIHRRDDRDIRFNPFGRPWVELVDKEFDQYFSQLGTGVSTKELISLIRSHEISVKASKRIYKKKAFLDNDDINKLIKEELPFIDINDILIVYIVASIRSIHINVSLGNGKVLRTFTTGKLGYVKKDRYQFTSIRDLVQNVISYLDKLKENSKKEFFVVVKGFGSKRGSSRFFIDHLNPVGIIDLSGLPFNGCRPRKVRRK